MSDINQKVSELEIRLRVLEQQNLNLMERITALEKSQGPAAREADSGRTETPAIAGMPGKMEAPAKAEIPTKAESPVNPEALQKPGPDFWLSGRAPALLKNKDKQKSDRTTESMEALIGGTWLNRIGIVAFIFGLGFFLKYSFDNNWIGPTGRIATGILAGLCLLVGGEYGQRKKYRIFAQGLTGGGIAALYFSIFAAFAFYHLLDQLTAFGVMILITLTAVLLSVRYNAIAIAMLGIVGGFLTPFFLSTGKPNEVGLFSYIALLDCGILSLAYFKKWRIIYIVSFVFTLVILGIWVTSPYSTEQVWTNQIFYTIFFAIFACLSIFYNMVHRVRTKNDDLILITANAAAFFFLSYINLDQHYSSYMGVLSFAMAVIYFIMGYLAWMRNRDDRFLVLSLWGISVVFLTITMPLQLDGRWITVAWAAEAAVLLWVGTHNDSKYTRMAALGVMTVALLSLTDDAGVFLYPSWYASLTKPFWPVANIHMVPFAACVTALFIMSLLYRRLSDKASPWEKEIWFWLRVAATGAATVYFSLEVIHFSEHWGRLLFGNKFRVYDIKGLALSVVWSAECIVLVWQGWKNNIIRAQLLGLFCMIISLLLLFGPGASAYMDPNIITWPVLNPWAVAYVSGVAALVISARKFIRREDGTEFAQIMPVVLAIIANLAAIAWLSLEVVGFYRSWGEQMGLSAVHSAIQMTLSVVWTLYAIALVVVGFIAKKRPFRLMSIAIFGVTILKVFLFDLANLQTIYRIVSFIGVGGLLVVVSYLYQRYRDRIFGQIGPEDKKGAEG